MTQKSPSRIARDIEKKEREEAAKAAAANTDFVEQELQRGGHYENNNSFRDLRALHQGLANSIVGMQSELLKEYQFPGLKECIDPAEAGRVKIALSGLSSDFMSFTRDLNSIGARYASKGDKATNQDDVFLSMSLAEEYQLLTTRMSEVIRPAYVYLATQAGIARTALERIVKPFQDRIAAEEAAAAATNPEVVTDVEVKPA